MDKGEANEGQGLNLEAFNLLTLRQTIQSVGEPNWAAVCSDSTNVTLASRRLVHSLVETILNLNDAIHHFHNTIGDINNLPRLKSVGVFQII